MGSTKPQSGSDEWTTSTCGGIQCPSEKAIAWAGALPKQYPPAVYNTAGLAFCHLAIFVPVLQNTKNISILRCLKGRLHCLANWAVAAQQIFHSFSAGGGQFIYGRKRYR
jgi:hypothetical protein